MEEQIGETIARMHARNMRVEADKAWETSWTRIGSIAVITYICATLVLVIIGVARPYLSAFVPVVGYVLSTQSLPFLKSWWLGRREGRVDE